MTGRIRSCFISAPYGANLEVLVSVLTERGIRVNLPDLSLEVGANWQSGIQSAIETADLVVGVMTRQRQSQWVLFELGIAAATGRQILLIVPPKGDLVPTDLRGVVMLRTGLRNRDAIAFAIDQLQKAPEPRRQVTVPKASSQGGLGSRTNVLRLDAHNALARSDYAGFERAIADAIRGASTEVVQSGPGTDTGVDLAVWSDALDVIGGNPLMIEIKARLQSDAAAARQLSGAVLAGGARWGLLIYGESSYSEDKLWKAAPPNVLVTSLDTLFSNLETRDFGKFVLELRNRKAHGVGV